MKKQLLAVILAVLALLSALSPAFGAAETDSAPEGAGMTVTAGVDDHKQVVVTWNKIENVYYYLVSLYNDSPEDHTFHLILSEQSVGSWNTSTIFLGNYIECYASGGPNYKAVVKAMDKNNQIIAQGSSKSFQTGIPILDSPEIIFNPNGIVSCTVNDDAMYYDFRLFDADGNQVDKVFSTSRGTRAHDFSKSMIDGKRYYVTLEIKNIVDFRTSAIVKSNTVTANTVMPKPWPTLSGTVKSYLNAGDAVTVKLDRAFSDYGDTQTLTGNNAGFIFEKVEPRNYFLTVSKKNHVTRKLTLPFSTDQTLNVKINPIGDVSGDGKVTVADAGKINNHIKKKAALTGYEFDCADIDGNGKITVADAGKINNHIKKKSTLW